MIKIKLMFEFMHGPIWPSDPFTGCPTTGNKLIDEDAKLATWNNKCSELYDECYEFDSHGESCYFNPDTLEKYRDELFDLIISIKNRLAKVDSSIIVDDQVISELMNKE